MGDIVLSILSLNIRRGWDVTATPGHFTPSQETRYPLYKRLGGPQGCSGKVLMILASPAFEHQTVIKSKGYKYSVPM